MYKVSRRQGESEEKKEIIREILLKYSGSVQGYEALQKELWASSPAQLQRIQAAYRVDTSEAQRRIAEIQAESIWTSFFFHHPEIRDTVANRKLAFEYALSLSDDGVVKFEHLAEAAKTHPGLDRQKVKQAPTAANLEQDKQILQRYCQINRLEPSTAVLNLLRQQFGAGFDHAQIDQAIQSGLISFVAASEENVLQWKKEEDRAEIRRLKNMELLSLRKLVREEGARGPVTPPLDQIQKVRAAETTAATQYPPLPDEYRDGDGPEQVLNAQFIKTCSAGTLKRLIRQYGSAQIDEVLRGETRTGEVWKY